MLSGDLKSSKEPGNDLFHDRPEGTQLMLELILIGCREGIPVIMEQPVEGAVGEPPGAY